jgi:hypothetical protein
LRLVIGDLTGETTMGDEEKLRRSLFAHIERKADEVWKSIDDLQKAMEAVSAAERSGPERSGPERDTDEELSKRFLELIKRLGDIRHQFQLGLAAIDESRVNTKH